MAINQQSDLLLKVVGGVTLLTALYVYWTGGIIHDQPDRESLIAAIWQHVGVGMLLFVPVLIFAFLKWRLPQYGDQGSPLATIVRNLFFVTFGLLLLTGPLTVWARGSSLKIFSWVSIPSPVERMQQTYEFLEMSHIWIARAFLGLLGIWCILLVHNNLNRIRSK